MANHNLSQLMGALGAWIEARRDQIPEGDLSAATRLILGGHLIGVSLSDTEAPELDDLNAIETRVVERARSWAFTQPESASSRDPADDPGRRLIAMMRASAEARKSAADAEQAQPEPISERWQAGETGAGASATPSRLRVQKAVEKAHRELLAERASRATKPAADTLAQPAAGNVAPPPPTRAKRLSVVPEQPAATPVGDESISRRYPVVNGATDTARREVSRQRNQSVTGDTSDRARSRRLVVAKPMHPLAARDWLAVPTRDSGEAAASVALRPQTAPPSDRAVRAPASAPPAISRASDPVPNRAFSSAASIADVSPARSTVAPRPGPDADQSRSAHVTWRKFEEHFWWGLCALAIVILAWRQLL